MKNKAWILIISIFLVSLFYFVYTEDSYLQNNDFSVVNSRGLVISSID